MPGLGGGWGLLFGGDRVSVLPDESSGMDSGNACTVLGRHQCRWTVPVDVPLKRPRRQLVCTEPPSSKRADRRPQPATAQPQADGVTHGEGLPAAALLCGSAAFLGCCGRGGLWESDCKTLGALLVAEEGSEAGTGTPLVWPCPQAQSSQRPSVALGPAANFQSQGGAPGAASGHLGC